MAPRYLEQIFLVPEVMLCTMFDHCTGPQRLQLLRNSSATIMWHLSQPNKVNHFIIILFHEILIYLKMFYVFLNLSQSFKDNIIFWIFIKHLVNNILNIAIAIQYFNNEHILTLY